MVSPFTVLFGSGVIAGSVMALSASSWFVAWVGLELNLLSFLPIIFWGGLMGSNESGIKYFFAQSLASLLVLVGSLFPLFVGLFEFYFVIMLGLLIKLGAAPFHSWFPSVIEGLGWVSSVVLLTWQKLAPLFLVSGFDFLQFVIICSVLVGSFGGFNQVSLSSILAYSSIMHLGWMLGGMALSFSLGVSYYFVYFFFSVVLVLLFLMSGLVRLGQLMSSLFVVKFSTFMLLLSMGGFPPMLGFFPKWYLIVVLLSESVFMSFFLIFSSLVNLFFYFRLFYGSLFSNVASFYGVGVLEGEMVFFVLCLVVSMFGGIFYPVFF
uniref:NADH-ubiquinone oxidoreductase chain 2 n=1 Tax=Centruroides vittatus TaxID=120091 RepID=A0A343UQG4_CENVT|nr:NADH dehydrogenase subunit 2 [Centruroides vittatus]AVF96939.1 NADH dehydrogenase subunit 2 [Centruroides vittatus]